MSEGANSCPSPSPGLTDAERMLLALVRERRMDAEIAVRLGLPTGEVKARIEALCSKVGAKDRAALRAGVASGQQPTPIEESGQAQSTTPRPGRRTIAAVLVGVLVLLVVGSWFVARDSTPAATAPTATPFDAARATAAAQLAAVTPASVATPATTVVNGRDMYDFGQMFVVSDHAFDAVAHVDAREALTVAYLASGGVARADRGNGLSWSLVGSLSAFQVSFVTMLGPQQIDLNVSPADEHTHFILGASDSVAFYNDSGGQPALMLQATTFGISFHWHVTVNASGELFIATTPTPGDALLDEFTGELLIDSQSNVRPFHAPLGTANIQFTACDYTKPPSRCRAVWRAESAVLAPADGWATCDSSGHGTFVPLESSWEIDFAPVAGTSGCKAEPRTLVQSGREMFEASHYEITAKSARGPLSAGVAGGLLYVGDFTGSAGCPCLRGS